jgi:hypothetical protein
VVALELETLPPTLPGAVPPTPLELLPPLAPGNVVVAGSLLEQPTVVATNQTIRTAEQTQEQRVGVIIISLSVLRGDRTKIKICR